MHMSKIKSAVDLTVVPIYLHSQVITVYGSKIRTLLYASS